MEMTFDTLADICYREQDENSQLISVSLVVKDGNSGEIRVYNSHEYGGMNEVMTQEDNISGRRIIDEYWADGEWHYKYKNI